MTSHRTEPEGNLNATMVEHVAGIIYRGTCDDPGCERRTPLEISKEIVRHMMNTVLPNADIFKSQRSRTPDGLAERLAPWRHGLKFFTKTNMRLDWVLVSYHSPLSITWSWALYFALGGKPFGWRSWIPVWWHSRASGLRVPYLFSLTLRTQQQMIQEDYVARWNRYRAATQSEAPAR